MKEKQNTLSNVKYLIKNAWKWDKCLFLQMTIYSISTAIVPFIGIFLPKLLLDELMGEKRITIFIAILAGTLIVSSLVNYASAYFKDAYQSRVLNIRFKFIAMLEEKCMTMDFKNTEDPKVLNEAKSAWTAVDGNIYGIEGSLRRLFGLIGNVFAFAGYIFIVYSLSPWILVYLIVNVLIVYYFNLKVKKYEYSRKEESAELDRKAEYIYKTMYDFSYGKDIRIYNLKDSLCTKFKKLKNERIDILKTVKKKEMKVSVLDTVLLLLREGLIYAYLIFSVIYKGMTIGDFSMYFSTVSSFAEWMQKVMDDIADIKAQSMYIDDFRKFLSLEDEKEEENLINVPICTGYEIEFKNVSFKYPNSDRYIYKDLSLKIKQGKRLAVVGINGAGKTTFVKLLTRLYEPTDGEILLNGINIKNFSKSEYYKIFSVVFQEIKMFAMTVGENISALNNTDLDRIKVVNAIERADMKEKIMSLPKGIDTPILKILDDDGMEFSGGQNQKLALARALYKDGGIVILDEPTAALDPVAEYNIYNRFNDFVGEKTAIYISHRLSSTRFCDAIAFFEDGKIQEYGTHEELLALGGKYSELFNLQAQYYKEDIKEEIAVGSEENI